MKNFKLILKSLISNHACIEGGRKKAWFFAIPMLLISMILALIPVFVQTITKQGDSIVSSNAYQMDVSSYYFLSELEEKGITLTVNKEGKLISSAVWEEVFTTKDASDNNCYIHEHKDAVKGEMIKDLGVYYMSSESLFKNDNKIYNSIVKFPGKEEGKTVDRDYSFIIFTEKNVYIYVYSKTKASGIGTIVGDYTHLEENFTINSIFVKDNVDKTWTNWKTFYRRAYDNNRLTNTWQTTLIMFGINAGITFFMGFMLWVLTRGKNNLRWFGIWETQKIAYWSTITPAILTTGLGFLLASFSQVIFPLLLGVRIMWLSMKLLRPENADVYPPLKNEKVVDVKDIKKNN